MVAITGITLPMGLSFVLCPTIGATPLQAFAAGAALCATSLGTTFTLLGTSGLTTSRLGVVLTSAAMMDDVVGLIMVQVISNLGAASSFDAVTVIRPVFVSLGLAIILPLFCRYIVLPITKFIAARREASPSSFFSKLLQKELTALTLYTLTLVGIVTGATYAGSSGLLGAYIAGAMISWWDATAPHPTTQAPNTSGTGESTGSSTEAVEMTGAAQETGPMTVEEATSHSSHSGAEFFEKYYAPSLQRVFKPLFFVSLAATSSELLYNAYLSIGICGILHPNHSDVHWLGRLARSRLYAAHDYKQAVLRPLASSRAQPIRHAPAACSDRGSYRTSVKTTRREQEGEEEQSPEKFCRSG